VYNSPFGELVISFEDGGLLFGDGSERGSPLLAESATSFFTRGGFRILFTRDGSGRVTGLTVRVGGRDRQAPKVR
jgi:hypothetical protein